MPEDKNVEERRQTQHKLEVMGRYWGAWCTIIAQGKPPYCTDHLWLVDTHAGRGLHQSGSDPDGVLPGPPLQAVLAARNAQRRFQGLVVHVRATDKDEVIAEELDRRLRRYLGNPPNGVDVQVVGEDWVTQAPMVATEMRVGHSQLRRPGSYAAPHPHLSLWFVDPYGIESLDHAVLASLPSGAEVIVNLDAMGALRLAGKARAGDEAAAGILTTAFGGTTWDVPGSGEAARQAIARAFAESFPAAKFRHRDLYPLRPSGNQDRFLVHLTRADAAVRAFSGAVRSALEVGTLLAGRKLSKQERDLAARRLHGRFRGQTLTIEEMRGAGAGLDRGQLRVVSRTAAQLGYGEWDEATATVSWLPERAPDPTLFD